MTIQQAINERFEKASSLFENATARQVYELAFMDGSVFGADEVRKEMVAGVKQAEMSYQCKCGRPALLTGELCSACEEADNIMAATCWICGKHEWHDSSGNALAVQECSRCEKPVCENCAETDFDLVGDPGRYVCTQWICSDNC